ncbi:hypothetical protein FA15DRAFT_693223 [Coprinopsis marcescibilis]|uniref:Uncharacterized protein n=1 Tax=Coprinopsis marcescibilis TaxID=230819 RepID=A0A5C3L044_COPMA|nr:hypothetical protein FA15DRAFT_693223 [Coprinopsis marcescibilis]
MQIFNDDALERPPPTAQIPYSFISFLLSMRPAKYIAAILPLVGGAWSWVKLDPTIIPKVGEALPVFKLGAPTFFPLDYLNQLIQETNPGVKFERNETVGPDLYAYNGDRLVGWVTAAAGGETHFFPSYDSIEPITGLGIDITRVKDFLSRPEAFPPDDTKFNFVNGSTLYGNTVTSRDPHEVAANISTPHIYLTHGVVERTIDFKGQLYRVCGPGSHASFGIGPKQQLLSLSHRWNSAKITDHLIKPKPINTIAGLIMKQLEPVGLQTGNIFVDEVDVCFYDSGESFMQPVYRFSGVTHGNNTKVIVPPRVTGYLPIGDGSPEALPPILEPEIGPLPTDDFRSQPPVEELEARGVKPRIRVARYVVRNDIRQWVRSAQGFWNSLTDNLVDWSNDQWYWGHPFLYTTSKTSFINNAHIALTEAHGNYHLFTTDGRCCDRVNIDPDFPSTLSSGYGGGARGLLGYWILHSCSVLPTPVDFSAADFNRAFDPWWDVFNGLHAVVSYRTQMLIADRAAATTARSISLGVPVVTAWLEAVITDSEYRGGRSYFDTNVNRRQPYGRPSAIFPCGHGDDRVWQVDNLGRPNCLTIVWYNN